MSMTKQILLEIILWFWILEKKIMTCPKNSEPQIFLPKKKKDVQKIVKHKSSCQPKKKKKKSEDALGNNKMDSNIFNWSSKDNNYAIIELRI